MEELKNPADLVVRKIDEMVAAGNLDTRAGLSLLVSAFREGLVLMSSLQARQNEVEQAYVRMTNIQSEKKLIEEENKDCLEQVVKDLDTVLSAYSFLKWVGGVVGTAVILLVLSIVFGQVQITYP
jgi:hypothetical protein